MTLTEDTWPPYDMRHTTYESPATSKGKSHLRAHHRRSWRWGAVRARAPPGREIIFGG